MVCCHVSHDNARPDRYCTLPWPTLSSDRSLIENVWDAIVLSRLHPTTPSVNLHILTYAITYNNCYLSSE
uniref:Tc1-like transposase DDE domain-containing protein n=1 Tax=Astyanax mexicanus TaxID=7994 RepID=A0A8B9LCX3_ASTMX